MSWQAGEAGQVESEAPSLMRAHGGAPRNTVRVGGQTLSG
jgi:hypothetical protein